MRCIGIKPPAMVSGKRLACELGAQSQTFALGMAMTPASRQDTQQPIHSAPEGRQLVFGSPGVKVAVMQGARDRVPELTFTPETVVLDEAAFQKPKKR